ncbi:MAG: tRNA (adenosine(37)-N6)-threonylcarbamoyltransferase complex dimerization subunit type 1 TsaB [Selenomonadaceae bacterium]|nr:tRNA (adenosine(37)-N6)-threonylcarbamoyltransferase complex dimerization subunit type 1 TsaB [Selenomonadaceae bacterium]
MLVLGIETSTRAAGVALISDDKILAEISQESKLYHSENLLPQIEKVLSIANVEKVDAVAVSIGPGSFTGLRIGLAAAKALAYSWQVKIIGVPTLHALAAHFPKSSAVIMPLIDAQKNSAYVQSFKNSVPLDEVKVKSIAEIVDAAGQLDDEVILCGDVLGKIKTLPDNVTFAPINLRMPRAVNVALCGKFLIDAGQVSNVMDLEPLYLRRSEAEELWDKRHNLLSAK